MTSSAPAPGVRHRLRFLLGVAAGAAVAGTLAHGFVTDAREQLAARTETRKAVVSLQALGSLLQRAGGEGGPARKVVAAWQAATPGIAQVRLARGMQLELSTAVKDTGAQAAPRRLVRAEKPLFDLGQRLFAARQTNQEEHGSRKEELELEVLDQNRLSLALALPSATDGAPATLELATGPLAPKPVTSWLPFLLSVAAATLAFGALALGLGERKGALAVGSVACLSLAFFLVLRTQLAQVRSDREASAASVAAHVQAQAALAQAIAAAQGLAAPAPGTPADWDTDAFRKPRGELRADGTVDPGQLQAPTALALFELRRAIVTADVLGLGVLLLAGLGALSAFLATLKRHREAYLYIAPAIVGMLVLVFYPFSYGISLSFTDSSLYNTNRSIAETWVGLKNYGEVLGDLSFVKHTDGGFIINYLNFYWTLVFTIVWTVTNVAIGVTSGLVLALILNTRALAFRPVYRVLLILPWAMPNYITALIWKGMFHQQFGVINNVFQMFGLPAVSWFDKPFTSFFTALVTNAWLSFPFMMVVSLGALQSIPADLYEAARVDGASRWQQFRAITLPSLRPALVPAVILSVVWTFNMFNIIYLVTAGDPGGATEILVTQAYKFAFERYRYGYAAAYSTVIFGILLLYGTVQNRLSKATEA